MARVVNILNGMDDVPGATLTRYCASSVQTTRMAFHAIKAGEGDVFVSAGVETVSRYAKGTSDHWPDTQNPLFGDAMARTDEDRRGRHRLARPARGRRASPTSTSRWARPPRTSPGCAGLKREELDEFGVRSQNLAEKAINDGFWAREITPVTTPDGTEVGEGRRSAGGRDLEAVSQLDPVFRPDGVVTAGNCCALNDGAAAVVVMSDTKAAELGATPLARIVATGVSGLSPEIMGLGPVEATKRALAHAGMSIGDIDLVEINEAFAAQVVPSYQDLGIDLDRLNVNGGAIAVGHPFGMTGARLQNTMLNSPGLARQDHRPDHDVRRRRPGHGADPRADLTRAPLITRRRTRRTTWPRKAARRSASASSPAGGSPPSQIDDREPELPARTRGAASCRRPRGPRGPPPGLPSVRQRSLRAAASGSDQLAVAALEEQVERARAAAPRRRARPRDSAGRRRRGRRARWPSTSTGTTSSGHRAATSLTGAST